MPSDPLEAITVDRQGCCRWSEVTRAIQQYQERIDDLEEAMEYIHRMRIMDSLTAIRMRAIARMMLKESWYETQGVGT
jgi:PleD family two-component response regulator